MATDVYPAQTPNLVQPETCGPKEGVKGDPIPYHEPLGNTSHAVLQVQKPVSPEPKSFPVKVFNGSSGKKIPVKVRSTDTIGKLQQKLRKIKPDIKGCENLVYNGKPVQLNKTMSELQVKPGATFITYQRCHGG